MAVLSKEWDSVLLPLTRQVDDPLGTALYHELNGMRRVTGEASQSHPPHPAPDPAHLQLGEVGSPVRQQLHRAALQAQGLLLLRCAELPLPALALHLACR